MYIIRKSIQWVSGDGMQPIGYPCIDIYRDEELTKRIEPENIKTWSEIFQKIYDVFGPADIVVDEGFWEYYEADLEEIPLTLQKMGFTVADITVNGTHDAEWKYNDYDPEVAEVLRKRKEADVAEDARARGLEGYETWRKIKNEQLKYIKLSDSPAYKDFTDEEIILFNKIAMKVDGFDE